MRLEATVPDSRGSAVVELADELRLSRPQNPQKMELPPETLAKMQELLESPAPPNERLRAAVKRHTR